MIDTPSVPSVSDIQVTRHLDMSCHVQFVRIHGSTKGVAPFERSSSKAPKAGMGHPPHTGPDGRNEVICESQPVD